MNPYSDQIVPDPESRPACTVASYNLEIVEKLAARFLDGRRDANNQCRASVLVSDDPGFGKTHLLTRILDVLAGEFFPVFVPPINAGKELARAINERLVSRLWRMGEAGEALNRFQWLTLQLLARAAAETPEIARGWAEFPLSQIEHPDVQHHFTTQRPELLPFLGKSLGAVSLREEPLAWASALLDILSSDLHDQTRATAWIKGRYANYPGLLTPDESDSPEPADEADRARVRLFDLVRLFALSRPILFVFDQVENYEAFGPEAARLLFDVIERLLTDCPQTQVLLAANATDWARFLDGCGVSRGVLDRFAAPERMRRLTLPEAIELRDLRAGDLRARAQERIPDALVEKQLELRDGISRSPFGIPRRFLALCAQRWESDAGPAGPEPSVDLGEQFEKARRLAERESIGFFTDAIRNYFVEVFGAKVERVSGYEFWRLGEEVYFAEAGSHHRRWEAWATRARKLGSPRVFALRSGRGLAQAEHLAYTEVPSVRWRHVPELRHLLDGPGTILELDVDEMLEVLGASRLLDSAADIGRTRAEISRWLRETGLKQPFPRRRPPVPRPEKLSQLPPPRDGIVQLGVAELVRLLKSPSARLPVGDHLPMRQRGILFHELACRFVQKLVDSDRVDTPLAAVLAEFLASEPLWREAMKYDGEKPRIGDALAAFAAHLERLRTGAGKLRSWQELYLATEFEIHQVLGVYEGVSVLLTGRCDVLRRRRPGGEPELVDYKLASVGTTAIDHQLQLALYAKLLSASANPMACRGTLEVYSPELSEVHFEHQELLAFFEKEIEPALRDLARRQPSGTRQVSLSTAESGGEAKPLPKSDTRPVPKQTGEEASRRTERPTAGEPDALARRIEEAFGAFGLQVRVIRRTEAPQLVRYQVRPGSRVSVRSLANRDADLQVQLGLEVPPLIFPGPGYVCLDLGKSTPDTVRWLDVMAREELRNHASRVAFPIGVTVDGTLAVGDFSNSNMAHTLVAGASGSGKSELLRAIVAALLARNRAETLSLSIVDPKFLTFTSLENCPLLRNPVLTNPADAMECLAEAVEEMDERYEQLRDERFNSLAERFATGRGGIPFRVIVFDEFADLILAGGAQKKQFEQLVARLTQKGRAAGIHLLLATQRPDREIVTGIIKANLMLRIGLRVVNGANSQIILGVKGAESLLGRGDLLCDQGQGLVRAQAPLISSEELKRIAETPGQGATP